MTQSQINQILIIKEEYLKAAKYYNDIKDFNSEKEAQTALQAINEILSILKLSWHLPLQLLYKNLYDFCKGFIKFL